MALPNTTLALGRMLTGALAALALSLPAAAGTHQDRLHRPAVRTFANVGEQGLRGLHHADRGRQRARRGERREARARPLDSKANPQEALNALKQLIDQDVRLCCRATPLRLPGALSDAVAKHNSRNPDQPRAVPELRRGRPGAHQRSLQLLALPLRCGCGHEDGRADQLHGHPEEDQEGLPDQPGLRLRPGGRPRRPATMLGKKRPDVQIVGDDLHPLGKVKDFAPYVAKIKASGADTVVTGKLGGRSRAAGEGRQGVRAEGGLLHVLRRHRRWSHRDRRGRCRPRQAGQPLAQQRGRPQVRRDRAAVPQALPGLEGRFRLAGRLQCDRDADQGHDREQVDRSAPRLPSRWRA